jgi:hypothetical protein
MPSYRRRRGGEDCYYLYRHRDRVGRLLYVGITNSIGARTAGHQFQSYWWPEVTRIEIERFPTYEKAHRAERRAIGCEHPLYNGEVRITEPGELVPIAVEQWPEVPNLPQVEYFPM